MSRKLDRKYESQVVSAFMATSDQRTILRRWRKRISPETLDLIDQLLKSLSTDFINTLRQRK